MRLVNTLRHRVQIREEENDVDASLGTDESELYSETGTEDITGRSDGGLGDEDHTVSHQSLLTRSG